MNACSSAELRLHGELQQCGNCCATSLLVNGLCLTCLFRGALEDPADCADDETFAETVSELRIRDSKWRLGNYEVLDEIGRGGMGVIYRAREFPSGRVVALKRVSVERLDSLQALARFRREAETAAAFEHPNIVRVFYVGESDDGIPFFTMKLASRGNLGTSRAALRNQPRQSVLIMAKVALAVEYAHDQGVFHRDLKPANILLDASWEPLVSDFGLAKWQNDSSELTRTLTTLGTPSYLAPEQAAGPSAQLTAAADVYSLGAILFELLSGRPPFLGEHPLAVIHQASERPAPKLRRFTQEFDRDLETICAHCLERDPSVRYQSATDLALDLNNWLDDRPIRARPAKIPYRVVRWARRNRMLASSVSACLVLGATSVLWQVRDRKLQSAANESALATRSVAVLPFFDLDNVSSDGELSQAVASSLQQELDLVGPARVRTVPSLPSADLPTAEQIRKAGETAKARAVSTGTVRMVRNKRRISLRLLNASTAEPLLVRVWEVDGRKYSKANVTKEIGATINGILNTKDWSNLTRSRPDSDLRNGTAREAMVAGRQLMFRYTAVDIDRAIDLFRKAIRAEPTSSLAHAYLAMAAAGRTYFISDKSFLELARAEAREALSLSPDSGDAHRALAGVLYQQGNFTEALAEELQTIEFAGLEERTACFVGMTLDILGHPDRALGWYGLARQLSGPPGDVDLGIGDCLVKLCDDQRAQRAYERADELQPDGYQGLVGLCHLRLLRGDFAGARELCRRLAHDGLNEGQKMAAQVELFARKFDVAERLYGELSKSDMDGGGMFYGALTFQSALGCAKQAIGDRSGGKAVLKSCLMKEMAAAEHEPTNPEAFYRLAAVEASLGMSDSSLQHLHKATNLGWLDYRSLAMDPRFDSLRQSADFREIIKDLAIKVAAMRSNLSDFTKIVQY
ncbi:MAG TPA: protein kinase [Chthoniobacterales bacterium]|nr:protein kinase [Chthoniobacterales bacterium]